MKKDYETICFEIIGYLRVVRFDDVFGFGAELWR